MNTIVWPAIGWAGEPPVSVALTMPIHLQPERDAPLISTGSTLRVLMPLVTVIETAWWPSAAGVARRLTMTVNV